MIHVITDVFTVTRMQARQVPKTDLLLIRQATTYIPGIQEQSIRPEPHLDRLFTQIMVGAVDNGCQISKKIYHNTEAGDLKLNNLLQVRLV